MKHLNEFLNEGMQTKDYSAIINEGWTVLTYHRGFKIGRPKMHLGNVISNKNNNIVVDIEGQPIKMKVTEDVSIARDNPSTYPETYTVFDIELVKEGEKKGYEVHSFFTRKEVVKFLTLDKEELMSILPKEDYNETGWNFHKILK